MGWYEKIYYYDGEAFQSENDMDRLMERLADRDLVTEQDGAYYLRMELEDILDFLAEAGELDAQYGDGEGDESWR